MRYVLLATMCLGLAACSKGSENRTANLKTYDVAEPAASNFAPKPNAPAVAEPIAVSVPKMAYSYKYSFVLTGTSIAKAQEAHVALCDKLGPARCQVLAMDSEASDEQVAKASLKIRVASAIARQFGSQLEQAVAGAGGRAVSRSITAEDVSKDMSDTAARLHQRELLVARLTEVLRTRKGSVAELVEAERSVAAAQEEIDQARSWLGELQGRVAMSTIDIDYAAAAPTVEHVGGGIGDAVSASGNLFVIGIGAILRMFIFLGPWLILGGLGWWGWRRFRPSLAGEAGAGPDADIADDAPPS